MFHNLKKIIPKLQSKFIFDYDIANHTWFKVGGKADLFCIVKDEKELEIILNNIHIETPIFVIGAGSNVLVRDGGFKGLIIKLGKSFNLLNIENEFISVGSSILDSNLSKFAFNNSLKGFEFFSGIPGSVGGAIKMNAGCYGFETSNILKEVHIFNKKAEKKILKNKDLKLAYRHSNLLDTDIVTSVLFKGEYGDKKDIESKITEIKFKRENSQPLKYKTGGSTFKNPKNQFAAKLIEESDCKGLVVGNAMVSKKHSNFLINMGNAKAEDLENLGNIVQEKVMKKSKIFLEWEIKIIGQNFGK
tara:strand:+ start:16 stop:924 length:909 start_codon:yes stop_codon:yes gene_type:complete